MTRTSSSSAAWAWPLLALLGGVMFYEPGGGDDKDKTEEAAAATGDEKAPEKGRGHLQPRRHWSERARPRPCSSTAKKSAPRLALRSSRSTRRLTRFA